MKVSSARTSAARSLPAELMDCWSSSSGEGCFGAADCFCDFAGGVDGGGVWAETHKTKADANSEMAATERSMRNGEEHFTLIYFNGVAMELADILRRVCKLQNCGGV